MCSIPTESLTVSWVTPAAASSSSLSWACVVVGGVDGERLGVADVGQVAEQLQALDELASRLAPALDAEGDEAAVAAREDAGRRPPCTGSTRGPGS